ncbi:uncharacterized protein LOC118436684 [Folsomia candida]|uniref:uncharacterized protein LOC118436684 n=1 Tax=Folsomia candida TaxID=158441 RepID=UPI00160549E6|nr:uncharacterized protein LOC118436684 [Folsomia candida]
MKRSVLNLSQRQLTKDETKALQLGLNFALPNFKHKDLLIEAGINIELCMMDFEKSENYKNHIRSGIARILHSEIKKPDKVTKSFDWLKPICTTLKKDQNIVIIPADKGNLTVIMDRINYDTKIEELLSDPSYSPLPNDPTTKLEVEISNMSKNLLKMKKLDKSQHQNITPTNSKIPRFYGLPKVHKTGLPFRPIVDFRSSPSYKLAHFLNKILKKVTANFPTHIKNSYEFAQNIKNFIIPPGYELVSFDVTSLFTRVPINETLKIIKKRLDTSTTWKAKTKLSADEILKLLQITINSNYFTWKNVIYKQNDGTPMGSPISGEFAEFFLQELEKKVVLKHPDIKLHKRFVDDCFSCIKSGTKDKILHDLNSFHPNIQFTCETEIDKKLPFLDIIITYNNDGQIQGQVYRKPTHTGRYLNYSSYHHPSQKIAVIDALVYRALAISDDQFLEDELTFVTTSLTNNGYPKSLINQRILRMKKKFSNTTLQQNGAEEGETKPRIILPYMGALTHRLTGYLRRKLQCEFGYLTGKKMKQFICDYKENPPPDLEKQVAPSSNA